MNIGPDVGNIKTADSEMNKALQTLNKLTEDLRDGRTRVSCSETENLRNCFVNAWKGLNNLAMNQDLDQFMKIKATDARNKVWDLYEKITQNDLKRRPGMALDVQYVPLVFGAMKSQLARVRMMKTVRADKSAIEEAEKRLENLKMMWLEDTEDEWSNIREEGPAVLTKNAIKGPEMDIETKELLKNYKEQGLIG